MIEVLNISKYFTKDKIILNNISFKVESGDTLAIIGQSGVGKSVLLKHLNGLLLPNKGDIKIDNHIINKLSFKDLQSVRKKMAMVFQFGALFDSMTVYENIMLALDSLTKLSREQKKNRIKEALSLVNLENIENMYPSDISGGMKKRVGIARAISINPEYVLYDEPTTGLDPINTDKMISLIKNIKVTDKATSIIVTHEMRIVNKLANKVLMLHEGKVIFDGSAEELNTSNDKYITYFVKGKSRGIK